VADDSPALKRELVALVSLVLVLDGLFIAGYYLFHLGGRAAGVRSAYTVAWTAAVLFVVLRGLGRIRAIQVRSRSSAR
jgi:hypothetical protein